MQLINTGGHAAGAQAKRGCGASVRECAHACNTLSFVLSLVRHENEVGAYGALQGTRSGDDDNGGDNDDDDDDDDDDGGDHGDDGHIAQDRVVDLASSDIYHLS